MRTSRQGMSLIEAILSLTVMALVVLLVANLYPALGFTVKRSENRLQADTLSRSLLAEQAARPFESLTVSAETPLTAVTVGGVEYRPSREVFVPADAAPDHAMAVRITVRWTERGGQREVVHETWIANVKK